LIKKFENSFTVLNLLGDTSTFIPAFFISESILLAIVVGSSYFLSPCIDIPHKFNNQIDKELK
jgi:hypothetical protein